MSPIAHSSLPDAAERIGSPESDWEFGRDQVSHRTGVDAPSSRSKRRPSDESRGTRAPQACERCRRKKLRCSGGCPCVRCKRANHKCDFNSRIHDQQDQNAGLDPTIRLAQLEKTVSILLSGRPNPPAISEKCLEDDLALSAFNVPSYQADNLLPFDQPVDVMSDLFPTANDGDFNGSSQETSRLVRFDPALVSDACYPASTSENYTLLPHIPPSMPSITKSPNKESPPSNSHKKDSPSARLEVASQTGSTFSAPFQPLTYQPALWYNKEQSRRASPQPDGPPSRDENDAVFEARAGLRDDPISCGIIDMNLAQHLFQFFIDHCHPFLPTVQFSIDGSSPLEQVRYRSSFLLTTTLAIAARFYGRHLARNLSSDPCPMDAGVPALIAKLAYSHLAASMFRKQHRLADVQATLLLGGWGLQSGGKGPDPWLVTGHCARLAHRLGLHIIANNPMLQRLRSDEVLSESDREVLAKLMPQWRTWLCWYHFDGFLSLGFGRPQTGLVEPVNEEVYRLLVRKYPFSSELSSGMYVCSLVQLTQIGRDLITWIQAMNLLDTREPMETLRGLNQRLDDWTKTWVWTGSLNSIQLGNFTRLAKLQCEHVRLCLNSMALRPGFFDDNQDGTAPSLMESCITRAAEAAIHTIQTHSEGARTDLALSYSIDYITITLGQAAVFLIRLHMAKHPIPVDRAVITHFLQLAIHLLEDTDLSETRNSTYVGKTCRDLCLVVGIDIPSSPLQSTFTESQVAADEDVVLQPSFDLDSFLQLGSVDFDLQMFMGSTIGPTDMFGNGEMLNLDF